MRFRFCRRRFLLFVVCAFARYSISRAMGLRQQSTAARKRKEGEIRKQLREVQAQLTDRTEEAARLRKVAYEQEPE